MQEDRHPALGFLDLTDADEDTWRLWAALFPLLLVVLLGLVLVEDGALVGAAGSVLAAGVMCKVITRHRRRRSDPAAEGRAARSTSDVGSRSA